jgi:hypothetical protein
MKRFILVLALMFAPAVFGAVTTPATVTYPHAFTRVWQGAVSTIDDDVVIDTTTAGNLWGFNLFMVKTTAGAVDVLVSVTYDSSGNCTNFTTVAHNMADLSATTTDPVVVTAPNRMYGFRGSFCGIQVLQNGDTDTAGVTLVATRSGD